MGLKKSSFYDRCERVVFLDSEVVIMFLSSEGFVLKAFRVSSFDLSFLVWGL